MPGQVFMHGDDSGLFFTTDDLFSIESLSPVEGEILNCPKLMMASTNVDSPLFRDDTDLVRPIAGKGDAALRRRGGRGPAVPGQEERYPFGG